MPRIDRRRFLTASAAASAAALWPSLARGSAWGDAPDEIGAGLLLPEGVRAERVLEIYLYGGLGPFESFYAVEDYGKSTDPRYPNEQWWLFQRDVDRRLDDCHVGGSDLLMPFGTDGLGKNVSFGPFTMPLRNRSDILERMRLLVMHHDLEPHEAAIPLALSGQRLGSSRMAGIGASVQRYFMERDTSSRRVPWSYVLYPDSEISTDNLRAASAVGLHTGASRPLDLRITPGGEFLDALDREVLSNRRGAYDRLVAHYADKAQQRYSLESQVLRSRGLGDYRFATQAMADAGDLADVLSDEAFAAVSAGSCGAEVGNYPTAMGIRLAAHLLTHPTSPARHITVVDGGLVPASGGGGYDTHTDHIYSQSMNLLAMLEELVSVINAPGENDPAKLNLDDTLIVLNTEFGRTPFIQPGSGNGTNHHPYGYVTAMIGGPVQKGILGAIGPDAWADRHITPTEGRAAVLAAMGIWPFAQESFAIGDLRDQNVEVDGLAWLNEIVLGRRST